MGLIGYPETSVSNYHFSLPNKPEERSSQLLSDGSLKSQQCSWFRHIDTDVLSMEPKVPLKFGVKVRLYKVLEHQILSLELHLNMLLSSQIHS